MSAVKSPSLWTLPDRPGLYRFAEPGEAGTPALVPREGAPPVTALLVRAVTVERALLDAVARELVPEPEHFVCDRCGCVARSAVLQEGEAVGACCSG